MRKEKTVSKFRVALLTVGLSFLAGGINGFVGTGGGIVIVYMLYLIHKDDSEETKNNFAKTIITVLPMSLISLFVYIRNSNVDFNFMGKTLIPALIGGAVGAVVMDKIDRKWLSAIFAALVIYSGISMIVR